MPKFEYQPTISLGTIIQFFVILCSAAGVYAAVLVKDAQHDERIGQNAIEIHRVEAQSIDAAKELREEIKEVNRNLALINKNLDRNLYREREDRGSRFNKGVTDVFSNVKPNTR